MKYKCVKPFQFYDVIIAKEGDILAFSGNSVTNITESTTYDTDYIPVDKLKENLEPVVDEQHTPNKMNNITKFKNITNQMSDTYERKNHDYGNSFDKSLDKFGLIASIVRMEDKMNRIESLVHKDAKVKDESIKDTLLDLANYAIMTVIWMEA